MKANSEEAARSVIAFRLPYLAKSGNIDNNALFYLKARGISEKEAIKMIVKGFLESVFKNVKNKEITELENKYKSKITFIFDNQSSLHEPSVEIQAKIPDIDNTNSEIKNKTKKKIVKKKTRVKKQSKTIKIQDVKETKKIKYIKKELKDDKLIAVKGTKVPKEKISETNKEESKTNDKTGWWS